MNDALKDGKIAQLLNKSKIGARYVGRTFDNFKAETDQQKYALKIAKYYADTFETQLTKGTSLIFCGGVGTGKTHLASAIGVKVCNLGRSVIYASAISALRDIKSTWGPASCESEIDVMRKYTSPSLLILDEVGLQYGTDSEKIILFELLNSRYENYKPSIVISNLAMNGIKEYLGERIVDRLSEGGGTIVVFDWPSYRSNVKTDKDLPLHSPPPVRWG